MSSVLDQLLVPPRLAVRVMADVRRMADAAVSIADLASELRSKVRPLEASLSHAVDTLDSVRDELAALRAGFEPMSDDLDALRAAFAATTTELQKLRESFQPELAGIHLATDGLHEEVGRQRESIDNVESTLKGVGQLVEVGLGDLITTLKPVARDLDEVREVMEPLQTATERVGRMAERLPGPGRKR